MNQKQVDADFEQELERYEREQLAAKEPEYDEFGRTMKSLKASTKYKKDAENGLSYDKLVYKMNKLHPRQSKFDPSGLRKKVYAEHPLWSTASGNHLCCKMFRKTDLAPYGVGIVLYFQFLKHLILCFFLMSLFSVPAYIFYFSGNATGQKLDVSNVKNLMTAFSLGNIGQCKATLLI